MTVEETQRTAEAAAAKKIRLSVEAQKNVIAFSKGILAAHKQSTSQLFAKMEAIDTAYARYIVKPTEEDGAVSCDIFDKDRVTPPIVVAQVDSLVAYLAEVYLSGIPLFPVVSTPANKRYAEQLETLLDDHAILGGYARQILMFLRDAVKYNYSAIECDWNAVDQFEVLSDFENTSGRKIDRKKKYFNMLRRLDPYNVVRDSEVLPGDVAKDGDFAGYLENISFIKLKRLMEKWNRENKAYNIDRIFGANGTHLVTQQVNNYRVPPTISNYITAKKPGETVDWMQYLTGTASNKVGQHSGKIFEKFVLYARILPTNFAIGAPQPNTPQIWKFVIINGEFIAYAERIISAYDYLPIFFGQPLEDGLGYQTQSVAEGEIPFQEAAGTLFNIRFSAARRAVADRSLYLADMIKPSDVNSKNPAAKIPVNIPALSTKKIGDAYQQIPFDMRGTETTISDAREIVQFSQQLHGLNNARQGMFQKGNKSVTEWNDTMGSADGRSRLPALCLEYQVFQPMKAFMVLNIFQYGEDVIVVSQRTGEELKINIDDLRKQILAFRIADGFTPKSKLASIDAIQAGMTMLTQNQVLAQSYGSALPAMFAHMMQLLGVRGLEEYTPTQTAQAGIPASPNLQTNSLQAGPAALPNPNAGVSIQ